MNPPWITTDAIDAEAGGPKRLLIVDGSPEDRAAIRRFMGEAPVAVWEVEEQATGRAALELCRLHRPDCILVDDRLPDMDGQKFLRTLIAERGALFAPAIVLAAGGDKAALAVAAMAAGAQDYLPKTQLSSERLNTAVRRVCERFALLQQEPDGALQLLREVVEQSGNAVIISIAERDPRDSTIVYVNGAFTAITGYAAEDAAGRTMRMLDGPRTEDELFDRLHRHLAAGESVAGETINYRKDGSERWLEWRMAAIRNATGAVTHFATTLNDVSKRKRGERALRESEERLRLALSAARMATWDWDVATGKMTWSENLEPALGMDTGAFGGTMDAFRLLVHPDDRDRVEEALRRALAGEAEYDVDFRIRRADGGVRWTETRGTVIRDNAGRPVRMVGVDVDITDRMQAETALRESEERFRLAQEAAGIGTWDWNIATGEVRWSAENFALHGLLPTADLAPAYGTWRQAVHPDDRDRANAAVMAAVAAKSRYEAEYRIVNPEGRTRWLAGRGMVIVDAAGRATRMIGINIDITERRNAADALAAEKAELERRIEERTRRLEQEMQERHGAQLQLAQAQKMEAIGQLTSGIAHDFNNFLAAIVGNLELLEKHVPGGAGKKYLANAVNAADHGAQLTQRLLAFSRRDLTRTEEIAVNQVIEGMEDLFGRTLGGMVTVGRRLAPELWPTIIDANQLEAALLNLAINARDAMPVGGQLTITTRNVTVDAGAVADLPAGDYVEVSVADTGSGMPPEMLQRVFEPFFTTKPVGEGTGLGLAMVFGFARTSGGTARIESTVGRGTTVSIYLPRMAPPAADAKSQAARAAPEHAAAAASGRTQPHRALILLVDDDQSVREVVGSMLRDLGHEVAESRDGAAALALLADPRVPAGLLIADQAMPGISGIELIREARHHRPDLPALLVTGHGETVGCGAGDNIAVLRKPFRFAELADRLAGLIGAAGDAAYGNAVPLTTPRTPKR